MATSLLLLLTAASVLCHISWTLAKDWDCEHNACSSSNDNKAIITQQQQQQQQRLQHDAQQLTEQLRLKLQKQQQQQQQQQKRQQQEFDPFDFANIRRLQQIKTYYDNSDNNNNNHNSHQLQQQQQRDLDNISGYKDNSNNVNNNNDDDDDDNNAVVASERYAHKYANNNNNNNRNGNNNHVRYMPNQSRNSMLPAGPAALAAAAAAAGAVARPQDARNDFRLQLSALNEPSRDGNNVDSSHTNSKNNNNGNSIAGSHVNRHIGNSNSNNNNNAVVDYNGDVHSIAVRAERFGHANSGENLFDTLEAYETTNNDDELGFVAPANDAVAADDELGDELPYGIQNVRKRKVRGSPSQEHGSRSTTYQSLCPTKRVSIPLETIGYEYRPNHYIEVTCAHGFTPSRNYDFNRNKICSEAGFSCIQLNRTIHLIRRNKAVQTNCWESEIRIVPSGCECMWPKHSHGDIVAYHEAQKRYTAEADEVPVADYEPGEGYLQIPRQVATIGLDGERNLETGVGIGFESFAFN